MIESILERANVCSKTKITVKSVISAGLLALAVILPQIAHLAIGTQAGIILLPMYLPVLLGGCLLGSRWGFFVGIFSPVVSFLITSAFGNPMPAAARLPFMMGELAVFAVVSGLFSKEICKKPVLAFPAVVLAELCGRSLFLASVALLQGVTPLATAMVWTQIKSGLAGLALHAAVVPIMVIILQKLSDRDSQTQ